MPSLITPWGIKRSAGYGAAFGGMNAGLETATDGHILGWMDGKSVAIGTMLPKLNWGTLGIYRDSRKAKATPPGIDQYDHMIPVPLMFPPSVALGMGIYREESKIHTYIADLHLMGVGVGPHGMTLMDWANALSLSWYGRRYDVMNKVGVADPMGDYVKRANVRTAMATMSWTAWLAMQIATTHDMQKQNAAGTTTAEIAASVTAAAAAVLVQINPIAGAIAGIAAVVVGLVGLLVGLGVSDAIGDLLESVAMSGRQVNPSDKSTVCAIFTMAENTNLNSLNSVEARTAFADAAAAINAKILEDRAAAGILFADCAAFRAKNLDLYQTESTQDRIARAAQEQRENDAIAAAMYKAEADAVVKAKADAEWEKGARKRNRKVVTGASIASGIVTVASVIKNFL